MAQSTPDNPAENVPRPLPRGIRPARPRDSRPRFQALDAVWIFLIAAVYASLAYTEIVRYGSGLDGLFAGVGTVALTYLLGWRASGRPAGIIAALLLATNTTFGLYSPNGLLVTLFALFTVAALFAFIAGSSLAALALAVVAVLLRPDSFPLGLMLLTLSLVQKRQRAVLGAALFLVPTIAYWVYLLMAHRLHINYSVGYDSLLLHWIILPSSIFLSWFVLPFLGELGDPIRRARWLPVVWWTGLFLLMETFVTYDYTKNLVAVLVPFMPLWFVLAGAGIARLLPAMTGDIPIPNLRYVVATLAVAALLGVRTCMEWPRPQNQALPPVTAPVPVPGPVTAPLPYVAPVKKFKTVKPPKKPHPAKPLLKPSLVVKPKNAPKIIKPKPTVPQFTVKNGRMVKRSKWAIQWDQTHPKP